MKINCLVRLFNMLKNYIRHQRSRRNSNILKDFYHGYVELEFCDYLYKILKQRVRESLYKTSIQESKKNLSDREDFTKELTFINRLIFKLIISKIKRAYELSEILNVYDLTSARITSTLANKNQIDNALIRLKKCNSSAEELHLIIPIDHGNSTITTTSFDIISRQFCGVNSVLIDQGFDYESKSMAVESLDVDFVSNSVLANYVPAQYKFSLSFNHSGGVIFDPHQTYHGFCNSLCDRNEFFYIKIQFKRKLSREYGGEISENNGGFQRTKIFLGDIKT